MSGAVMHQTAPYPETLAILVKRLSYREDRGWKIWLSDADRDFGRDGTVLSSGLTLIVQRCGPDTYHPEKIIRVNHYFAVPAATYNRESWMRWLFDRLGDVDTHERMEDFALWPCHDDGTPFADTPHGGIEPVLTRPFSPCHGPGWDPYLITVERTDTDRRTSFRGVLDDDGTGRPRTGGP